MANNVTLTYKTSKEFYDGIYELTVRGLTFWAEPEDLTITLTGGY